MKTKILFALAFLVGGFTSTFISAQAWAGPVKKLASDPSFWGVFVGILVTFQAAVELLKKYGIFPSKSEKQVENLDRFRQQIAPNEMPMEETPFGKAMHSSRISAENSKELHNLFYNEHGRLILNKLIQEAIHPSLQARDHAIEEIARVVKKIEESDNLTAVQIMKVTNLLTLQNKRIRNVIRGLNAIHSQEYTIPNMFPEDDDE